LQHDAEQGVGRRQADAQGLSGSGELGLPVGIDDDGVTELLAEGVQAVLLLGEALVELWGGVDLEGGVEGVRLAVESLTLDAALAGEGGDVAVATVEDSSGTGEVAGSGYAIQGMNSCG
jgi:hypothetical protein